MALTLSLTSLMHFHYFFFHTYRTLIAQIMTRKIRSCHDTGNYTVIALQNLMMTFCCLSSMFESMDTALLSLNCAFSVER